jgi:hypothetical protein
MNLSLNRTGIVYLQNKSGGALAYGAVAVLDATNLNAIDTTNVSGFSDGEIVVVIEPAGIANDGIGLCAWGGIIPLINLTASASIGDLVKTSSTPGMGAPHAGPRVEGDFAQVLSTGTTPSAILFGSPTPAPTAGSTGGMVWLGKQVASSSASLDFTSLITSDYDVYQFEFENLIPATNGVDFWSRLSTNNGVSFDSSNLYVCTLSAYNQTGAAGGGQSLGAPTSALKFRNSAEISNTANYGVCGSLKLFHPLGSAYKRASYNFSYPVSTTLNNITGSGVYQNTTAVDAIQFLFSSGNIASGTIHMYGLVNS